MSPLKVAILSFPGNNCEVESIRAIRNSGMEPIFSRWNADTENIKDADAYFIPGGFSYEDRGRAGMVAARDPLLSFLKEQAQKGKVIIGNCNGAQILVESGLIPLGNSLEMSLARNIANGKAAGFLNEWVYITPTCPKDRCATSNWEGVMHIPIAHGEGRFTTKDKDLLQELQKNNQIVFSYCDADGEVSDQLPTTPNGSTFAAAGICNPQGNVIALMPHPERTPNGDPYFISMKKWIEAKKGFEYSLKKHETKQNALRVREPKDTEIFIDTRIVNNEERTVEKSARSIAPKIHVKQFKYFSIPNTSPESVLSNIALFNANKEVAYIRRGTVVKKWNASTKEEENVQSPFEGSISLLRRDEPDTGASSLQSGSQTGVCYSCKGVSSEDIQNSALQEVFANTHASSLDTMM